MAHPRRRFLSLLSSRSLSLRSPTSFRNCTFSRYPPARRFALSSSLSSASACECVRQSMADFSMVVSFFAFCELADGMSPSCTRDFRRVGFLSGAEGAGVGVDDGEATLSAVVTGEIGGRGMSRGGLLEGSQSGHFLASSESSATSTTSLSIIQPYRWS